MFSNKSASSIGVNALVETLVDRLCKDLPPTLIESRRKVLSVNKITRLLESTYAQVADYKKTNKLGFIRRAVLANKFKWALKNKGYPEDFISVATEGLVVELSKRDAKGP